MATFRNTEHQKISAIKPNGSLQGSHKCWKRKSVIDMVALSPSIASIIPAKNKVSPNVKATNAGIMIAQISINSMKLDNRSMNHVRKKVRRRASRAGTPNATRSSELWCGTRKEETPRAASAADMGKLDWYYGGIWGNGSRYPRCQMSCLWDLIAFVLMRWPPQLQSNCLMSRSALFNYGLLSQYVLHELCFNLQPSSFGFLSELWTLYTKQF